jgi:hypothetical protein
MDRNNLLLHEIRATIESQAAQINQEEPHAEKKPAENRMKETMLATIVKQFQDVLADTEKAQTEFSEAVKRKIGKQVRISKIYSVDQNATEEEVERCVEDPRQLDMKVKKELMGGNEEMVEMVENIRDKYKDIKVLEQVSII